MIEPSDDVPFSTDRPDHSSRKFTPAASRASDPSLTPDGIRDIGAKRVSSASAHGITSTGEPDVTARGSAARREALRAIAAATAALMTTIGLGRREWVAARSGLVPQRNRGSKRRPCKCAKIGLTSNMSEPFSLAANTGATVQAPCPAGFIALSGGLQGGAAVETPCMIRESHPTPDGEAWIVNVYCTAATNTPLRVGAICFSENSFDPQNEGGTLGWGRPN